MHILKRLASLRSLSTMVLLIALLSGITLGAAHAAEKKPEAPAEPVISEQLTVELADIRQDFLGVLVKLRASFHGALGAIEQFPSDMYNALDRETPKEEVDAWVFGGFAAGVAAVLIGLAVAIPFERMTIGHPRAIPPGETELSTDERVAFLLKRAGLWLVGTLILLVVGLIVLEYFGKDHELLHRTALLVLVWYAGVRAARQVFRTIIAPGLAGCRIVSLEDGEAGHLMRSLTVFAGFFGLVVVADLWLMLLELPTESRQLFGLALSLVLVLLLVLLCIVDRKVVTKAIGWTTGWRGWVARNWWIIGIVYFVITWVVRAVRVLIGDGGGSELVVAPVLLVFAGLGLQGISRLVLAQMVARSPELVDGHGERMRDYRDLAHTGSALLIFLVGFAILLEIWGFSFTGTGAGIVLIKAGLIAVFGYLAYQAIAIAIERKLAMEGAIPGVTALDPNGQPLPPGQSRIATLLPLARVFLLTGVFLVTAMMVLSELGVQVAPLFASAGIIGLAIGFGSQQLVHDVMSGAFFLVDDAFRVGEFIDVGSAQGTVEHISIRSFQLRRTNGDLITIPFGGIKQINNLSRDWQVAKLPFKFPLGTDVEKVRKTIKKVGERLLANPEVGPKFLTPPKSQGIHSIDSSGVTIRVKFMTKPLDLFAVKRQVYVALTQAFAEAGLNLVNNVVTVRLENAPPVLTDADRAAIAGAAAQALVGSDDDDKGGKH